TLNQRLAAHELSVTPAPEARRRRSDYFGNRTVHFSLSEPHRQLEVLAESVVDVTPLRPLVLEASPAWESVRDRLRSDRKRDTLDAYAMTLESEHVAPVPALHDYAAASFEPGRPVLEAVRDLIARIHTDF